MPIWWTGRRSSAPSVNSISSAASIRSATLDPSRLQRMLSSAHVDCELEDNRPVRLRNAAGLRLQCIEGIAWITFHGEPNDLMLHSGQVEVVPNDGLVLMEAVGHGRVRIMFGRSNSRSRTIALLEAAMANLPAWLNPRRA